MSHNFLPNYWVVVQRVQTGLMTSCYVHQIKVSEQAQTSNLKADSVGHQKLFLRVSVQILAGRDCVIS